MSMPGMPQDADEAVKRVKELSDRMIELTRKNGLAWIEAYEEGPERDAATSRTRCGCHPDRVDQRPRHNQCRLHARDVDRILPDGSDQMK